MSSHKASATVFAPELNIPGLTLRHWKDNSDFEKTLHVMTADKRSQGVEEARSVAEWQAHLESQPNMDVTTGGFLLQVDGDVIAFQNMRVDPQVTGTFCCIHYGYVLPEWQGRGIGRALIRHAEQVLRTFAAQHPPQAPKYFQSYTQSIQLGLSNLLEQEGYQIERYFYEMVRPNLDDLPMIKFPQGIETRLAQPEDYHKIWDTLVESFKEHWGEIEHTEADYLLWLKRPQFRPDLWQVAWDGDLPVAVVLNEHDANNDAQYNRRRGFTEDIGTLKEYRGRGIAQALIVRGLQQFKDMGLTEAELAVDAENATGALRLYEKLGYRPTKTFIAYRKPLYCAASPVRFIAAESCR